MRKTALILVIAAALGCGQKQNVAPAANASPAPAATTASANQLSGRVAETIDSGGYTYLRLETPQGDRWAAIQQAPVKQGSMVTVDAQMTLDEFESKTLNRKFNNIVFGVLAGDMPAGHPNVGASLGTPQEHTHVASTGAKVEKAAGGKTVEEVWAGKSSLRGKEVVVRGKVVKYLSGIMGKNWLHLQDGSGSGETADLTVTTNDTVAVGDVITVKGVLAADKDFGAGYRYAVIVENATVVR